MIPSYIKIKILALRDEMFPLGSNGLKFSRVQFRAISQEHLGVTDLIVL